MAKCKQWRWSESLLMSPHSRSCMKRFPSTRSSWTASFRASRWIHCICCCAVACFWWLALQLLIIICRGSQIWTLLCLCYCVKPALRVVCRGFCPSWALLWSVPCLMFGQKELPAAHSVFHLRPHPTNEAQPMYDPCVCVCVCGVWCVCVCVCVVCVCAHHHMTLKWLKLFKVTAAHSAWETKPSVMHLKEQFTQKITPRSGWVFLHQVCRNVSQ